MEIEIAREMVKTYIRETWKQEIRQGKIVPKPQLYFFDVDLTALRMKGCQILIKNARGIVGEKTAIWQRTAEQDLPRWAFFVDDQPEANWEHKCRYIFAMNQKEPNMKIIEDSLPPDDSANAPLVSVEVFEF